MMERATMIGVVQEMNRRLDPRCAGLVRSRQLRLLAKTEIHQTVENSVHKVWRGCE